MPLMETRENLRTPEKNITVSRPKKKRNVFDYPESISFVPSGRRKVKGYVALLLEGYEAIRLSDYEGLPQKRAAAEMGVSRATFSRILREARKNVAEAITTGKLLKIQGGSYAVEIEADPLELEYE